MFVRKKKNHSGVVSIQVIDKSGGVTKQTMRRIIASTKKKDEK